MSNKQQLEGEEFDIAEDLERSMEMFNGLLKSKDEEIETLTTEVQELKIKLEHQVEKDEDFVALQRIAEDEADTISSLEKENIKLLETINDLEDQMKVDKKKMKTLETNIEVERKKVFDQLSSTVAEVDNQREKYQQLQALLTEARDDIMKLEEENTRLKDQVTNSKTNSNIFKLCIDQAMSKWVDAAESDFHCLFQVNSDIIGITHAIHIMDDDDDSDTKTIIDDDKTECCDILIDDLDDDIAEIATNPS